MKNIIQLFTFLTLLFSVFSTSYAQTGDITRGEAFIFLADSLSVEVPESFQFIKLSFLDIQKDSPLEDALQKLVYLNLIKNKSLSLYPEKKISIYNFEKILLGVLNIDISGTKETSDKRISYVNNSDLKTFTEIIKNSVSQKYETLIINTSSNKDFTNILGEKSNIFDDVYKTLSKDFYGRDNLDKDNLINGAIKGLVEGSGDNYTTYFPAVQSSSFFQGLDGEFEGIGAYVEMPKPGSFFIISPIVGSPAERAGILGGDKVIAVDGKNITTTTSLDEAVSWIKGFAGTQTTLTIQREGNIENILITVTREKINIDDISYSKLDTQTAYIQIKSFGNDVNNEFDTTLKSIAADRAAKKIIIDVRNNPGGYLDQVALMLSHFVKKGESTVIVSNGKEDMKYQSLGFNIIDASAYKIIVLQNGGSASASEILIGTLKDYHPEVKIIGEKSYGKGSVQSLKTYYDGSTLKYTSAKWYTGKTRQAIDQVGIIPDITLEYDAELFKTQKIDNQLQEALRY